MPHAFDTGLDKPQRTKIRDAIIARLAPLKKSANPALYVSANGIKTLPRPFRGAGDDEGREMLAQELQGMAPGIAIALGRTSFEARGTSAVESGGELEIAIYVVSAHLKGLVEGRLYGDAIAAAANTNDPGLFTMLEHVRELLLGQELAIDGVGPLRPQEEDEVATFADFTVWEQRYLVDVDIEINPQRGITQLLESIQVNTQLDGIDDDDTGSAGQLLKPLITTVANLPPES